MKLHHLTMLFLSALVVAACKPKDAPADPNPAETPTKADTPTPSGTGPVATVNGNNIDRALFDRQMDRTRSRFKQSGREIAPKLETRLKENLLRTLVDAELIKQKAKSEGVSITEEEIVAKFNDHKKRFGDDTQFAAFLERTKQSAEDVRADLANNLLRDRLFDKMMAGKEPTEADAKKQFEENSAKYKQREQVAARHILFKVKKTAPKEERAAKKKLAQDVLKKAKAKGADFDKLAREFSEGPTKARGGDLGKFSRGRMVKEFENAAFTAKPGSIIGPIETAFGYHVINVTEKTPERQRPFEEVKDSILTSLRARAKSSATRKILVDLKKDAKITVLEPGLSLARKRDLPGAKKPVLKTIPNAPTKTLQDAKGTK